MTLIEPRFRGLFLSVFALFTLFGTSMTIIGATLPKILANFHWNYLTAGIVLGAGAVAYFVSTFVAGYLVKHWGSKPTILLALTLIVVGLAFFATTPDPAANTLLSALIGLGQSSHLNVLSHLFDARHRRSLYLGPPTSPRTSGFSDERLARDTRSLRRSVDRLRLSPLPFSDSGSFFATLEITRGSSWWAACPEYRSRVSSFAFVRAVGSSRMGRRSAA